MWDTAGTKIDVNSFIPKKIVNTKSVTLKLPQKAQKKLQIWNKVQKKRKL